MLAFISGTLATIRCLSVISASDRHFTGSNPHSCSMELLFEWPTKEGHHMYFTKKEDDSIEIGKRNLGAPHHRQNFFVPRNIKIYTGQHVLTLDAPSSGTRNKVKVRTTSQNFYATVACGPVAPEMSVSFPSLTSLKDIPKFYNKPRHIDAVLVGQCEIH